MTTGWRDATADDLTPGKSTLTPATVIKINGGEPKEFGEQLSYFLPGHYPFLLGMARFGWDIKIKEETA